MNDMRSDVNLSFAPRNKFSVHPHLAILLIEGAHSWLLLKKYVILFDDDILKSELILSQLLLEVKLLTFPLNFSPLIENSFIFSRPILRNRDKFLP